MRNIKMTIRYDGSRYKGFQRLKDNNMTIQGKIEDVLSKIVNENIEIIGSGRTDMGVHAYGQVANFKTNSNLSIEKMKSYLYEYLPEDIVITNIEEVSERFHSRLNVISKTYVYTIDNNRFANVFLKKYAYHVEGQLNIEKMREASKYLIGTHDFKSFSGVKDKSKKSTVRTINYINITEEDNIIKIEYNGNGFLLNMVRILSGTLIKVAKGEIEPIKVKELLKEKSRSELAEKAPAKGLCMKEVKY